MTVPARDHAALFSPEGVEIHSVSPRLITSRLINDAIWTGVPFLAGLVLTILVSPWWLFLAVPPLVIGVWVALLIPRQVRSIGYAERDDDLLVRKGILFRTLVVVPYGRMQYVDVSAGPLDRKLGIATVQLHTASAGTDATIPGLPPEEAERLRDRLTARGEAKLAGL